MRAYIVRVAVYACMCELGVDVKLALPPWFFFSFFFQRVVRFHFRLACTTLRQAVMGCLYPCVRYRVVYTERGGEGGGYNFLFSSPPPSFSFLPTDPHPTYGHTVLRSPSRQWITTHLRMGIPGRITTQTRGRKALSQWFPQGIVEMVLKFVFSFFFCFLHCILSLTACACCVHAVCASTTYSSATEQILYPLLCCSSPLKFDFNIHRSRPRSIL